MNRLPKVAIIGGGISGLSCVYHLQDDYQLTLFERHGKLGGHTDTHSLKIDGKATRVDSGFIIFCPDYYPHFSSMLDALGVEKQETNMSFAAQNPNTNILYNATTSLNKMFCQRRNLLRPRFWRMLFDIARFYHRSEHVLGQKDTGQTVASYLEQHRYGPGFIDDHLLPMMSALWSTPIDQVKEFPIQHLVEFFSKHGLLKLWRRPSWYVVKNGSASYVEALAEQAQCDFRVDARIDSVERQEHGITIHTEKHSEDFDAIIFCCHANQALSLMHRPSETEKEILGAIPFSRNHVVVHTDETQMPDNRLSWASWNTRVPVRGDESVAKVCSASYWMNLLQGLKRKTNIFTDLNNKRAIQADKILAERLYYHPVFNPQSVAAQKRKSELDGQQRSYYAGAYWGWGFHEDGARSAFEVCQQIKRELVCNH